MNKYDDDMKEIILLNKIKFFAELIMYAAGCAFFLSTSIMLGAAMVIIYGIVQVVLSGKLSRYHEKQIEELNKAYEKSLLDTENK